MTIDAGLKPEGAPALPHSWRRRPLGRRRGTEALFGATQDGGGGAFVAWRTRGQRRRRALHPNLEGELALGADVQNHRGTARRARRIRQALQ